MSDEDQLDGVLETLEQQRDEAVSVMDGANPSKDYTTVDDIFDDLTPIEPKTYSVELELHDYELISLISGLMEPMDQYAQADQVAVSTSLLIKLIEETPEHMERMGAETVPVDTTDNIRGYQ